ncbi:MAG: 3-deoxy-7-phosphoheptulonate synthase [Pseudomonadota bacterium]
MLLRLSAHLSPQRLGQIRSECEALGYRCSFEDEAQTLLRLHGDGRPEHGSILEDLTGVDGILERGEARELHERGDRAETVIRVGQAAFGGGNLSIIAGPCAVEDPTRLEEIAHAVKASGATMLRGGAWKPRTSPYSFQGVREKGLEWLREARERTGLAVVTEVLDPRDVELVGESCDMFQIGARSMANFALLSEVGQTNKPVLLKRGLAATVREFLLAAEFILSAGNTQVVLCERGIRSFDKVTRNPLDVGAIAHLKRATHLPVIADPSHAAGRADLVRDLARAGLAAGADGLIVEVHPAPEEAHSDADQAISPEELSRITRDARILAGLDNRRLVLPDASGPDDGPSDGAPRNGRHPEVPLPTCP